MSIRDQEARDYHFLGKPGKIEVVPTKPCLTARDLSLAYTPGVAEPCLEIEKNPERRLQVHRPRATWWRWSPTAPRSSASATSAPLAGKPVMEGKGVLFKRFADIDVFDIELDSHDPDEIIKVVPAPRADLRRHQPRGHQGPRVLLHRGDASRRRMKIPVFHDDQHGTAIISGAALHQRRSSSRARSIERREGRGLRRRRRRPSPAPSSTSRSACQRENFILVRHQGRRLQGPHGGHEPVQGAVRRKTPSCAPWPTP